MLGMVPLMLGMVLPKLGMVLPKLGMTALAVGMTRPSLGITLALTTRPPRPATTQWQDSGDLLRSSCPRSREQLTRSSRSSKEFPSWLTPSCLPPWLLTLEPLCLLFLFFSKIHEF